jgi:hypothetical protein
VQHLAKLRARRVASNKEVPPPLRRGGSASTSKTSGPASLPTKPSSEASSGKDKDKPKSKARKVAVSSDEEDSPVVDDTDDEDGEYGKRRRSKDSGQKKSQKKRKLDSDVERKSDSERGDGNETEDADDDVVAVGAQFLSYPNDSKLSSLSATSPEDEATEEDQSKIVILHYGRRNSVTARGDTSLLIDNKETKGSEKAASKEAEHTAGYFNGNASSFSTIPGLLPGPPIPGYQSRFDKDGYVLPLPKGGVSNLRNWPKEAVLQQYDRDDPRIPGVPQVPKTIIPAAWLRDEKCEPQLLWNRVLDNAREETYPECRESERKREDYKEYMAQHRELPYFFDPEWNLPPTLHMTDPKDDYKILTYLANEAADPEPLREQHSNFNALKLRLVQLDKEVERGNMVDMNHSESIHKELDYRAKLPPGKCYDLMQELEEKDAARPYEDWLG